MKIPVPTKEEEIAFTNQLLSFLATNNLFAAKMALRKILQMRGNGFKYIRQLYIKIFSNGWRFTSHIRQTGITTGWSSELIQLATLENLTRLLAEADKEGLVKKGKFYTIPTIPHYMLCVDPRIFEYLFDNERILPSTNFSLASTTFIKSVSDIYSHSMVNQAYTSLRQNNIDSLKNFGYDLEIILDPIKVKLLLTTRVVENLTYLMNKFNSIYPVVAKSALKMLTEEFLAADNSGVVNSNGDIYYQNKNASMDSSLKNELHAQEMTILERNVLTEMIREKIFKGIQHATVCAQGLSGEPLLSPKEILEKYRIDLDNPTYYIKSVADGLGVLNANSED